MARSRDLKVNIIGDADKLDKEVKRASGSLDKLGKQTRLTSSISSKGFAAIKIGATGAAAGLAGLAIVGKKVADAAIEAETSQAKLEAQFKASGLSYRAHAKEIDAVIAKHSQLAGVDDEDLQDAFTAILRTTGSVSTAMRDMGLVTDLARTKNMDVAKAGDAVAKVHAGQYKALKTLNLEFVKTTANVDKLKASDDKITPAELAAAKAADVRANATRALGMIQDKVKGQAEAYGNTTKGSMDRANVAFENLQETAGKALAPAIEKVANKTADFVNEMQDGTGQGGRFAAKLKDIWQETKPIVTWIGRAAKNVAQFTSEHPGVIKLAASIVAVGVAVKALRLVSAVTGFTTLVKAGRVAARTLTRVLSSGGEAAGAAAAENAASSFSSRGKRFSSVGRGAGKLVGRGLIAGFILALPTLWSELDKAVGNTGKRILDKILPAPIQIGRQLGKKATGFLGGLIGDGVGNSLPKGGDGGNLMGANAALGPFAAMGSKFGLHVTSGARPGAITSSGNVSHHSAGRAIDMAGPPGKMLAFFRSLKASAGGRLAELIYTPGGVGIKNGRPFRYTGAVAKDHYDHVHVAYAGGDGHGREPGTGDGLGKGAIMNLWTRAGGSPKVANLAAAVALAESGGNTDAKNQNTNGSIDRGLWQINSVHGKLSTFDPTANARAAVKISSGGSNWRPWVAYTSGSYKKFLSGGGGGSSKSSGPSAAELREARHDAAEKSGSRAVNKIAAKFSKGIAAATASARSLGTSIEDAGDAYGRTERKFGQTDEDLGTAGGRAKRGSEIAALKVEKGKQLAQMNKRAAALRKAITGTQKQLTALQKARGKAKGAKRAKMSERIAAFHDRLTDLKAELKALGGAIADTKLDIGDLDKEAAEVAGTEDTVPEAGPTANDKLSEALSDIDAQERAGLLSPDAAKGAKIATLQAALGSGALSQREQWAAMGDLREAQEAAIAAQQNATDALAANTQQMKDLQASIDQNTAVANSAMAIQGQQALRWVADQVSGEVGVRASRRGTMPGNGQLASMGNRRY